MKKILLLIIPLTLLMSSAFGQVSVDVTENTSVTIGTNYSADDIASVIKTGAFWYRK